MSESEEVTLQDRFVQSSLAHVLKHLVEGYEGMPPEKPANAALIIGGHASSLIEAATNKVLTTVLVPYAHQNKIVAIIQMLESVLGPSKQPEPPDNNTLQ